MNKTPPFFEIIPTFINRDLRRGGLTVQAGGGHGVACRASGWAILYPVSLLDARSSPGDLGAGWSCVRALCLGVVGRSISVFVSCGGFYIFQVVPGRSSCKCSANAPQCGTANRCHWAVASLFSFHFGDCEDAKRRLWRFFWLVRSHWLSWRPIS